LTKTIHGNLVLEKDTTFDGDIVVEGDIIGKKGERYALTVKGNLKAYDVLVADLFAVDVIVHDIFVGDIFARNLTTHHMSTNSIFALKDIFAGDIAAAGSISARSIWYNGVCYAYRDIECTSIEGMREDSRHFSLDGKVIIIRKKEE